MLAGMHFCCELKRTQEARTKLRLSLVRSVPGVLSVLRGFSPVIFSKFPVSHSRHWHCFSPRRASRYARMNGCRSPSSTRSTSPTSVFVR